MYLLRSRIRLNPNLMAKALGELYSFASNHKILDSKTRQLDILACLKKDPAQPFNDIICGFKDERAYNELSHAMNTFERAFINHPHPESFKKIRYDFQALSLFVLLAFSFSDNPDFYPYKEIVSIILERSRYRKKLLLAFFKKHEIKKDRRSTAGKEQYAKDRNAFQILVKHLLSLTDFFVLDNQKIAVRDKKRKEIKRMLVAINQNTVLAKKTQNAGNDFEKDLGAITNFIGIGQENNNKIKADVKFYQKDTQWITLNLKDMGIDEYLKNHQYCNDKPTVIHVTESGALQNDELVYASAKSCSLGLMYGSWGGTQPGIYQTPSDLIDLYQDLCQGAKGNLVQHILFHKFTPDQKVDGIVLPYKMGFPIPKYNTKVHNPDPKKENQTVMVFLSVEDILNKAKKHGRVVIRNNGIDVLINGHKFLTLDEKSTDSSTHCWHLRNLEKIFL